MHGPEQEDVIKTTQNSISTHLLSIIDIGVVPAQSPKDTKDNTHSNNSLLNLHVSPPTN